MLVDGDVEALREAPAVPGHPGEADLALLLRAARELRPLGVPHHLGIVDRVVEVDVDVVGLQAAQALLEPLEDLFATHRRRRLGLRDEHDLVASAGQCTAEGLLGFTALVCVRGVEVGDAAVERVVDQRLVSAEAAPTEADVGHLDAARAERRPSSHRGRAGCRRVGRGDGGREQVCADAERSATPQQLPPVEIRSPHRDPSSCCPLPRSRKPSPPDRRHRACGIPLESRALPKNFGSTGSFRSSCRRVRTSRRTRPPTMGVIRWARPDDSRGAGSVPRRPRRQAPSPRLPRTCR